VRGSVANQWVKQTAYQRGWHIADRQGSHTKVWLQGRKRQEGYIGKLLMSLSSEQQEEIDRQLNGMRKKSNRT